MDHPPLLRARGEGKAEKSPRPPLSPSTASNTDTGAARRRSSFSSSNTGELPQLSTLDKLLAQVKADAASSEARKKFNTTPTRIPKRERTKGVGPLAQANSRAKE